MSEIVNRDRLPVPLALAVLSAAAAAAMALPPGWPIRTIVVATFLLVGPGLMLLPLVPAGRGRWVFIVPLSLAINLAVAQIVVLARGDLTVAPFAIAAVVYLFGVGRAVWLVSRPPETVAGLPPVS